MACFTATFGGVILLGFINFSTANKDTCELYAAVGQSLTLPFVYEGLAKSDGLKWFHNEKIIFSKQGGKVSLGKSEDISSNGSLLLKNIDYSSAGIYKAEILHPSGTVAKSWTGRLCMMDKVSKPQLSFKCDFSYMAEFNCQLAKSQGLAFSWTLDGETLTSETKQTLRVSLTQLKGRKSIICSVANHISKASSDKVRPSCSPFLYFTPKTVLIVLAGEAGLILLLLIIIVALCCCLKRKKSQKSSRNNRELRLLSLTKREPDSVIPDYETMHPSEDLVPLNPQPSPRVCNQNASDPEVQPEKKPPQLYVAAESQQPSPVPKPRTKNLQTTKI